VFISPSELAPEQIEEVEKASARLVTQAVYEFRDIAFQIFSEERGAEKDLAQDIAEDVTREALDRLGVSRMDLRLFGKIDYKRARYVFYPGYAVRQALFVDSKAEQEERTITIQTTQTSMRILQIRANQPVDVLGGLPRIIENERGNCITTTLFVKYRYEDQPGMGRKLLDVTVAALPNGVLQDRYNPSDRDTVWSAGRNAPTLGESFRVRISLRKLKAKGRWRVQTIPVGPDAPPPCRVLFRGTNSTRSSV
jgi:hypothetical protein